MVELRDPKRVKADDERGDAEWANTSTLRVLLLHACYVLGDVNDRDRLIQREAVALQ